MPPTRWHRAAAFSVGMTGIEPAHLAVLDPKSSASASSATSPCPALGKELYPQETVDASWMFAPPGNPSAPCHRRECLLSVTDGLCPATPDNLPNSPHSSRLSAKPGQADRFSRPLLQLEGDFSSAIVPNRIHPLNGQSQGEQGGGFDWLTPAAMSALSDVARGFASDTSQPASSSPEQTPAQELLRRQSNGVSSSSHPTRFRLTQHLAILPPGAPCCLPRAPTVHSPAPFRLC